MPTRDWLAKYYIVSDSSMPPPSDGLPDYSFHRAGAFSKHLGFLWHRDPKLGENIHVRLYHFIKREFLNPVKKKKQHFMYTLHMYMMTRYADLSGKTRWNLEGNLKNHFLKGFAYSTLSWYILLWGVEGVRISSHTLIIQYFSYSVQEINSLCEKYEKKNIFDYSFNIQF